MAQNPGNGVAQTSLSRPARPCAPITIKSASFSFAVATISQWSGCCLPKNCPALYPGRSQLPLPACQVFPGLIAKTRVHERRLQNLQFPGHTLKHVQQHDLRLQILPKPAAYSKALREPSEKSTATKILLTFASEESSPADGGFLGGPIPFILPLRPKNLQPHKHLLIQSRSVLVSLQLRSIWRAMFLTLTISRTPN